VKHAACTREDEVLALVSRLHGALHDPDVLAHVEECDTCAAMVSLATALRTDRDEMLRAAHVPAAGQVWWRAALRAHADAAHAARRPIVWLQGIAAACLLGVATAFGGAVWGTVHDGVASLVTRAPRLDVSVDIGRVAGVLQPVLPLAIVIGVCLLVTPVVVYLALSDD